MVRDFLTRTALPVAAYLAIAAWSLTQAAEARAETVYLARLALVLLLAASWVAVPHHRFTRAAAAVSSLAVLAVWSLPSGPREGPHRGMVVTALLLALLVGGLANRLNRGWDWRAALPLAVAVQAVFVPDLLLSGVPWHGRLLHLGILPLLSGLAVAVLARRLGPKRALLAAGLAAALSPGFDLTTTLLLGALAAAAELRWGKHSRLWRGLAMALMVMPAVVSPGAGLLALAAASYAIPGRWLKLAAPVLACGLAILFPLRPFGEAFFLLPWVFLVAPIILAPEALSLPVRGGAAILGAAGALAGPSPGWLAPAVAMVILGCDDQGPAARFQTAWGSLLVAGAMLFAGYPWLRTVPLTHFLERLGVTNSVPGAILISALGAVLILGDSHIPRARNRMVCSGVALATILALWLNVPRAGTQLLPTSVLLGGEEGPGEWQSDVSPTQTRWIIVESSLGNAEGLDHGVKVATLTLTTGTGTLLRIPLRLAKETDEWSARRGPEGGSPPTAPSTFFGWVDTSGEFFGLRYRALLRLPANTSSSVTGARLELSRNVPEVTLGLFKLEARP